jgi:hypothetical protein
MDIIARGIYIALLHLFYTCLLVLYLWHPHNIIYLAATSVVADSGSCCTHFQGKWRADIFIYKNFLHLENCHVHIITLLYFWFSSINSKKFRQIARSTASSFVVGNGFCSFSKLVFFFILN